MSARKLNEISEAEADAELTALYTDIKHCLGVPVINLIFRNMATIPGCLQFVWDTIRPLYVSGQAAAAQHSLVEGILPGSKAAWSQHDLVSLGLKPNDSAAVISVFETYIRANPANMMGMLCLENILKNTVPPSSDRVLSDTGYRPAPLPSLLPMVAPDDMSQETAVAYVRLTEQLHGPGGAVSPSLYRHFAPWPALMSRIADLTQGLVDDDLTASAEQMLTVARQKAISLSERLPAASHPRPAPDVITHILDLATLFPPNMCKMTILAEYLRRGLVA